MIDLISYVKWEETLRIAYIYTNTDCLYWGGYDEQHYIYAFMEYIQLEYDIQM